MKNHSECKSSGGWGKVLVSKIIIQLQQLVYTIQNLIDIEYQTVQFTAIFTVVHTHDTVLRYPD